MYGENKFTDICCDETSMIWYMVKRSWLISVVMEPQTFVSLYMHLNLYSSQVSY